MVNFIRRAVNDKFPKVKTPAKTPMIPKVFGIEPENEVRENEEPESGEKRYGRYGYRGGAEPDITTLTVLSG